MSLASKHILEALSLAMMTFYGMMAKLIRNCWFSIFRKINSFWIWIMNHLPCAFLKQVTLCSSMSPAICQTKMVLSDTSVVYGFFPSVLRGRGREAKGRPGVIIT